MSHAQHELTSIGLFRKACQLCMDTNPAAAARVHSMHAKGSLLSRFRADNTSAGTDTIKLL